MSKSLTLLALTLCAAPALAGSTPVVIVGTVSGNSLSAPPFAGIPPGSPVTMSYQVTTPGVDVAPGQDTSYTMVPSSFTVNVAGATATFTGTGGPPQLDVVNNFPVADGLFTFVHAITVPGHALECEMHNSTGTVFNTTDIAQLVGTYPGSAFDSVDWNIFGPGGGMSITAGSVTIYPDVSSPIGASYCTSTMNSSGNAALISANGCPSVAVGAVTLHGASMPANKTALFFYGPGTTQVPFGNGFLCVGGSLSRLPAGTTSGSGTFSHSINFHAPPAGSGPGMILPGSTWHFQGWFRDGAGVTNTTDATAITFAN